MTHRPRMRARRRLIKTGAQTALDVCAILGIDERKMLRPPGAHPYSNDLRTKPLTPSPLACDYPRDGIDDAS